MRQSASAYRCAPPIREATHWMNTRSVSWSARSSAIRVLPMDLRIGDRLASETGDEWEYTRVLRPGPLGAQANDSDFLINLLPRLVAMPAE